MDRPILNPTVFDDPDRHADPVQREPWQALRHLRLLAGGVATMVRAGWKLLWTPLIPRRIQPFIERTPLLARVVSAMVMRVTVFVALVLATALSIVHVMTHPLAPPILGAPSAAGVHLDALTLRASDGVASDAFLAPALDEDQVIRHGDRAVRAKWPAVVLVPDQRGPGDDLDRLIPVLHKRGYVVLLVRLRGASDRDCPQTFGLSERLDVLAGLAHLRTLDFVDASRVSVIATGTGATAAMLARKEDDAIDRLILHAPLESFDAVLRDAVNAPWLRPACRWAFEVMHHVDAEDVDRDSLLRDLGNEAMLLAAHPARVPQREMIVRYLQAPNPSTSRQPLISAIR